MSYRTERTMADLQADLERIDRQIDDEAARLRKTADRRLVDLLEQRIANLQAERGTVLEDIEEARLREWRDSPHPPAAMVPRKSVGPLWGLFAGRISDPRLLPANKPFVN